MSDDPKDAKGIFLAAVDIADVAERAAFVQRSCGGDVALKRRVDDLLRAYGEPDGPLDKLAAALASTEIAEPIREQVGATIGPYRLMEQIGEGGFGLVFVAEQQQPIRRKVALKIIKPGMDTRDVIARFEAERQALALMDHPNIARVLDAGTTESGRPYFVMELVRGVPITDYCDQAQLAPRERLELFVPICNAIQHAHVKGIIHRDIKPSNVLVTLHDGKPVVKVIDFGVAKALHQSLTDKTIYTRLAQMVGTPLYMSPEQAEMSGLDIDTRTDVYSLGVLLYELLTGMTPFDKQRLAKAAYDELLKIIREEEPPKPSARLSQSTETLPSIAAQRKTEPAKLTKMFAGDLDWIAMKALEKDRARRYETANAFAADVLRYLNDEPVEASPPSTAYRLRKFARKHRKPVMALVAIAGVLVLGIVGTTWGLFRATQAERAAGASEKIAVDALKQVTQERDAKETQRDHAERQLANGLLRPIGFSTTGIDPAELRSFVDWSAINESPLKMRVLEIAFERPETALRVARRAERVVQSCVGLSPARRAQAIELVSAKQRDLTADARIRVAACWLALDLGSADLPAWAQSCKWLSEPKNQSIDRFDEFVNFAFSRSDPQQIAQLDVDPSLAILETTTNDRKQWFNSLSGLYAVAPRFGSAQAARVADALIGILEKSSDQKDVYLGRETSPGPVSEGFEAFAPRLEPAQAARAVDALCAIIEKSLDRDGTSIFAQHDYFSAVCGSLAVLAPRLDSGQVNRAGGVLIAMLAKTGNANAADVVTQALTPLVSRLERGQVNRAGDAMCTILEKSTDTNVLYAECMELRAIGPQLERAQLERAGDALIAILEKSTDTRVLPAACTELSALGPRLRAAQVKRARDALIAILEKSTSQPVAAAAGSGLAALGPGLEPGQVKRAGDALIRILEKSTFVNGLSYAAANGLPALLAARLEPAQVRRAGDDLIGVLEKPFFDYGLVDAVGAGLPALAARLEPAQVKRAGDDLIGILEKSTPTMDGLLDAAATRGLQALAPRLEPAQIKDAWHAMVAMLEKSTNTDVLNAARSGLKALAPRLQPVQVERVLNAVIANPKTASTADALRALAPRLERAQIKRGGDALIAILEKSKDVGVLAAASSGLQVLAPRLERAQAERAWDALLADLESETDADTDAALRSGLATMAPRLESAQLMRAWNTLIAAAEKSANGGVPYDPAWDGLVALAPRLEAASRDNLSTSATATVLDYCSFFDPNAQNLEFSGLAVSIVVARSISSPRSLAKLLSHPACVAQQREIFLKRFEELVFHDGKPIFLKPDATDEKKPAGDPLPPRRFHNLHDAADWIQKNWPDFDLETNCPVTWRGSR